MPIPRGDVDAFVRRLSDTGFLDGVDRRLRVELVLRELGIPDEPEALRALLSPIVARNRDEQAGFVELFDTHFQLTPPPPQSSGSRISLPHTSGGSIVAPPVPPPPRRRWREIAGLATAAAIVAMVWLAKQPGDVTTGTAATGDSAAVSGPAAEPSDSASSASADTLLDGVPGLPATPIAPEVSLVPVAVGTSVVLLAALLILLRWLNARRQRFVRREIDRKRRETPPFVWTPRPPTTRLFVSSEFFEAARIAQRRQRAPGLRVSIERTVSATVEAAGMPTIRYERASRPPEYLVLIERLGPGDHQALLFDALVQRLGQEGIFIERFFYERDPRVCRSERHGIMSLGDLEHRFRDHRLVLLGSGDGLLDDDAAVLAPWTTSFDEWGERALLTPNPVVAWGAREEALAELFAVLPASAAGLRAVVEGFELEAAPDMRWWREAHGADRRIPRDPGGHLPELRQALGEEVWRWLCACAVYPDLHWALTLYLGGLPELGGGKVLVEDRLLRLSSLPWFRNGFIPPALRTRLLDGLSPATERAVREAILAVLGNAAPAPDSAAGRWHEAQVLVQLVLTHPSDRATQDALRDRLKELPRALLVRDPAARRRLGQVRRGRVARVLPDAARRFVYRDGISLFGVRPWARRSAGALVFLGLVALRPDVPEPKPNPADVDAAWFMAPTGVQLVPAETISFRATLVNETDVPDTAPVRWSSSDSSVLVVDSTGYMRAVAPGTARVRLTASGRSANLTVVVRDSLQGGFRAIVDRPPKSLGVDRPRTIAAFSGALRGVEAAVCDPDIAVSDELGRVRAFESGVTRLVVRRGAHASVHDLQVDQAKAGALTQPLKPVEFDRRNGSLNDVTRLALEEKASMLAADRNVQITPRLVVVGAPASDVEAAAPRRALAEIRGVLLKGRVQERQLGAAALDDTTSSSLDLLCDPGPRTFFAFDIRTIAPTSVSTGRSAPANRTSRGPPLNRTDPPNTVAAQSGKLVIPGAPASNPKEEPGKSLPDALGNANAQAGRDSNAAAQTAQQGVVPDSSELADSTREVAAGNVRTFEPQRYAEIRVRFRQAQEVQPAFRVASDSDALRLRVTIEDMPRSSYAFARLENLAAMTLGRGYLNVTVQATQESETDFEVRRVGGYAYLMAFATPQDVGQLSSFRGQRIVYPTGSPTAPCAIAIPFEQYRFSGSPSGAPVLLATRIANLDSNYMMPVAFEGEGSCSRSVRSK